MLNMHRLEIFVSVVKAGSFTGAAQTMGLTKAVVSFNIKRLEESLGVSLLTRSTRKIAVTETGQHFYQRCLTLLENAEEILDDVRHELPGLHGLFRITTNPEYGSKVVVPALSVFASQHPQLSIQHTASSHNDDLISGRFDVAIRLGQLNDSTHHAKMIDWFDIYPVASKEYLTAHYASGLTNLTQLQEAHWIAHTRLSPPLTWQVLTPTGDNVLFKVRKSPSIMVDSAASLLEFVRSGSGVALLPAWLIQDDIKSGHLIHLLPEHRFPRQGIYALYPNTRHVSERVRKFIDFFQEYVDKLDD